MNISFLDLKKKFDNDGYFVFKNFLSNDFIVKLIEEINIAPNTVRYSDNSNNLRRLEKLYDKGKNLIDLNKKISILLKNIFNKEFLIFKDKFNIKPPGGEGFIAHYDGVFEFIDANNEKKRGWYEYGDFFVSALVAIDKCNSKNGTLELAKSHKGNFEQLFENTKKDGTPALSVDVEAKTVFEPIDLEIGDIIIFSNSCPHRSQKNNSQEIRRIIYYTYTPSENGSKYKQYFADKDNSKDNKSKSFSEKP